MATEETEIQNEELDNEQTTEGQETPGEGEGAEESATLTADQQAEETNAENDEERERIRERRRQERHDKKEAQREREASMRRELASRDHMINELNSRLAAVEKRGQTTDVEALDHAIKQSAEGYNYFKEQIAIAARDNNGPALAEATEKMIIAQRRYEDLNRHKQSISQRVNQPAPMDPRVAANAKSWHEKHSWYDPNAADDDSYLIAQIDKKLHADGWNPATPQYWQELDERAKKYLPHRYKTGYNGTKPGAKTSPVTGSGRESAPSSNGSSFKLSPERVQALKDSGKWNDPKERERMIKYYQNYDKTQLASRN